MNAKEMFRVWMDDPYYDDATKAELKEIEGNDMEIEPTLFDTFLNT